MSLPTATVFGAYGHTARFVVAELHRRGWGLILAGRDIAKLNALAAAYDGAVARRAVVEDSASLDAALEGADVVINCAGPFAYTVGPLIEAAMRARIPYLDLAAEIEANLDTFANFDRRAREAGIVVVPAMAFFGGLGDLLASAAMGDWSEADEISIAYGLDSWKPTLGTKAAGAVSSARRNGRRLVFSNGSFESRDDSAQVTTWTFPPPLGKQPVVAEFTMADTVTIAHHVKVPQIRSYMTRVALADLVAEGSGPPSPTDASGRSSQSFLVDVVVRSGNAERRASAAGRDIYAISAPLVVRAAELAIATAPRAGVYSAGELFDARAFLEALSPEYLALTFSNSSPEARKSSA